MRILHKELKYGRIKVYIDTMDDLWYLKNVLVRGDMVRMLSFRTRESAQEKLREKKSEKVPMMITLVVEDVEFHPFSNYLRIKGRIVEASEAIGEYHTFTVEPGSEITMIKSAWETHELGLLSEAEESSRRSRLLIVSIDDEEATLAVVRAYGIEKISAISSGRSGKQYADKSNWQKEFFGKVAAEVERNLVEGVKLAIAGPGFIKDLFSEFLGKNAIIESTSDEGMNGVKEAIKKGVVKRADSEIRVAEEYELVDELLRRLSGQPELCALGQEAERALRAGAAETLLLLDEEMHKREELLRLARDTSCSVRIISSEHEAGKTLRGFGGVAALLRFRLYA
jgi:protein pelota